MNATLYLRTKAPDFIFMVGDKEVMRITSDGELIVHDSSEAAACLVRYWRQMTGQSVIDA